MGQVGGFHQGLPTYRCGVPKTEVIGRIGISGVDQRSSGQETKFFAAACLPVWRPDRVPPKEPRRRACAQTPRCRCNPDGGRPTRGREIFL